MKYFDEDFIKFFMDLAANNNRDWFKESKPRFDKSVKEPFQAFVNDMAVELMKVDKSLQIDPKKAVFRIYRDIRFSKDKTPYKLHMAAILGPGGRTDHAKPGMYLQMGAEDLKYFSGMYKLEKADIMKVRSFIMEDIPAFQKVYKSKEFEANFGELHGEKNKILPKEMKAAAEIEPLIFNKSFYYYKTFEPTHILKESLIQDLLETHGAAKGMRNFLNRAVGN